MNFPLIVADESVDARIINALREAGFIIYAISEISYGISDTEVINFAVQKEAFILTEDKDFGDEIVYRKAFHYGALLLRLSGMPIDERIKLVLQVFDQYKEQIKKAFSVLNTKKLRIRN